MSYSANVTLAKTDQDFRQRVLMAFVIKALSRTSEPTLGYQEQAFCRRIHDGMDESTLTELALLVAADGTVGDDTAVSTRVGVIWDDAWMSMIKPFDTP